MGFLSLFDAWQIHAAGAPKFTRRMAIHIADDCMISVREAVLGLERLGMIRAGAWRWFQSNGGITRAQIEQVRRERVQTARGYGDGR